MSATCPQGHASESTDYCDVCGAPMGAAPAAAAPSPAATPGAAPAGAAPAGAELPCPNCALPNAPGALFCEACGYDFTTGVLPRTAAPAPGDRAPEVNAAAPDPAISGGPSVAPAVPLEWVAEIWVDPDWYAEQDAAEPCPSPGLPVVVPLTVRSLLIGRASRSRGIHPEVDCDGDDAVSRRQAQLTTDGSRWFVEDLSSSNGTYVGTASGPMPTQPLPPGQRRELAEDDRVYVGAWTRIVVRRATPEERA
ncbi:FHA domain-containing protein [Cellulomonas sp. Marseille-Q8402]